ncbi:MAG: RNA 2',3'-cyclic phosphodiesterase [Pseudomonadales bacterium]|nr:RNA 2',3'-cyclic phosphodiesterase [Pseudomonadales bacterium]
MESPGITINEPTDKAVSKVRCFLGFKVDALDSLSSLREQLISLATGAESKLRPITDENLHLTLWFFGSVSQESLVSIQALVENIAGRHTAIRLKMQGLGFFKNAIWIGVEPDPELLALAEECKLTFDAMGFGGAESRYIPHITIARFGKNAKLPLSQLREKFGNQQWGEINAQEITLFRSDTLPEGARYSVISSVALAEP